MAITPNELPELIAAAVKKAVQEGFVTEAHLTSLLHKPVTIGIIYSPATAVSKSGAAEPAIPSLLPIRMGFRLDTMSQLNLPEKIQVIKE